jgi:hypothetical protein
MRRSLWLIALVFLAVWAAPVTAATKKKADVTPKPGGVVADGTEQTDETDQPNKPKPSPKTTCAGYEEDWSTPSQGPQPGLNGTTWAWKRWRCPPGGWSTISVCVSGPCPDGPAEIPPEPTSEVIHKRLLDYALKPIGRYAPPVENPGVKAIVGMRFYFSVDPSTYKTLTPEPLTFPGGWSITATLTPGTIDFAASNTTASCDGPGASGRTKAGRDTNDTNGCYVVFQNAPKSGQLDATITTHWHIKVIRSNFNPAVVEWDDITSETTTIGIHELQAVVEK